LILYPNQIREQFSENVLDVGNMDPV